MCRLGAAVCVVHDLGGSADHLTDKWRLDQKRQHDSHDCFVQINLPLIRIINICHVISCVYPRLHRLHGDTMLRFTTALHFAQCFHWYAF